LAKVEQRDYELIRPIVRFGSPASERAKDTAVASEHTLQRRVVRFEAEGMESLFGSEAARRRGLPPSVRRLIVDLKAQYPGFNSNEIATACYLHFGKRPARLPGGAGHGARPLRGGLQRPAPLGSPRTRRRPALAPGPAGSLFPFSVGGSPGIADSR
jgi:hypothetical protein